jgi:hypothetical protein
MRNTISKAMIAGLAGLTLAGSVLATTEPASAAVLHGWGGARGGGAWHGGGGWHGGGAWRGGGRGWNGGGGGGWWGPAAVGGVAAGALLAAPYYGYGYGYGYGGSCTAYSPMYDAYGNYIGQQLVNVC